MSQFDPSYYRGHDSGIECITLTEHMGFSLGSAVKYLWRLDDKDTKASNLGKAHWYVNREIERRYTTTPVTRRRPLPPQYKASVPRVLEHEQGWRHEVLTALLEFPEYEPTLGSLMRARDILAKVIAEVG